MFMKHIQSYPSRVYDANTVENLAIQYPGQSNFSFMLHYSTKQSSKAAIIRRPGISHKQPSVTLYHRLYADVVAQLVLDVPGDAGR